jgi:hypothetical protein
VFEGGSVKEGQNPGPGVDVEGNPVLDPTKNVLDLVDAANLRQDDLRKAEFKRQDDLRIAEFRRQDDLRSAESRHLREVAGLRAEYQAELRRAETERINAVREVDVQAVQRAAEVQAAQQQTLANQVVATADAFRVSLAAALEPIIRDIADLRKTQYEQAGQRAQVGESRLNYGALLGGVSVALVLIFGIITVILSARGGP